MRELTNIQRRCDFSLDGSSSWMLMSDDHLSMDSTRWHNTQFSNSTEPSFTVPEVTAGKTYTFSLVVNDGTASSVANEVIIT